MTKLTKRSPKTKKQTVASFEPIDQNVEDSSSQKYVPPAFAMGEESLAASSVSRRETVDAPILTYPNLDSFDSPFRVSGGNAFIDTREAIRLSIKAYWAFPLLRNVVEVMGELANSKIFLKGGNKKTRDFVEAWLNKINHWQLKEQFFREWFRSANCFFYRIDGEFQPQDAAKMTQVFGAKIENTIPVKYIILNPETITASGNIAFNKPIYYQALSGYELQRLRNPTTKEDKNILKGLDKIIADAIRQGSSAHIPLKPENLSVLLYKAQSYEPMGVPMAYGVLKDIEAKLELKRIDLSIARTTDRALLLISVGETPTQFHKNGNNINYQTLASVQAMFSNESISRTLIADYTVKGEWLIPDINKILGAEKYEQLDKDISAGLNAIFFETGEKFANTSIKAQIFIERLKEARNAYLNNFLQPEIIRVCQTLKAKSYPEAIFEELSLKDEVQYDKLMTTLAQLGFLTPEELFEAMDSGKLPVNEESVESQRKFKELKDEGLYMPIIGGATQLQKEQVDIQQQQVDNQLDLGQQQADVSQQQADTGQKQAQNDAKVKQQQADTAVKQLAMKPKGTAGRPTGSKAPKSSSKTSPIGTAKAGYSLAKLRDIFPKVSAVHNEVDNKIKSKYGIDALNEAQAHISSLLVESIISNEPEDQWINKIPDYLGEPKEISLATAKEIEDIQIKHNADSYLASILRLIITEAPSDAN